MIDGIQNITIVGMGVIGGSYAMALSAVGYTIFGVDIDERSLASAKAKNVIVEGSVSPREFFAKSDLIVLALYPDQIAKYIKENIPFLKSGCIITDVAGLKSHFVNEIEKALPPDVDFVFCHPMAGREKKGFDFADSAVFKNANFIITPTARTSGEAILKIKMLAYEMGFGNIKELSPDAHDAVIAYTSQLPHALAVALVNSDCNAETGNYIGDSYRELTRIANINEKLWAELFLNNKENFLTVVDNFEKQLDFIKNAVKNSDTATLETLFKKSSEKRGKLQK